MAISVPLEQVDSVSHFRVQVQDVEGDGEIAFLEFYADSTVLAVDRVRAGLSGAGEFEHLGCSDPSAGAAIPRVLILAADLAAFSGSVARICDQMALETRDIGAGDLVDDARAPTEAS